MKMEWGLGFPSSHHHDDQPLKAIRGGRPLKTIPGGQLLDSKTLHGGYPQMNSSGQPTKTL